LSKAAQLESSDQGNQDEEVGDLSKAIKKPDRNNISSSASGKSSRKKRRNN